MNIKSGVPFTVDIFKSINKGLSDDGNYATTVRNGLTSTPEDSLKYKVVGVGGLGGGQVSGSLDNKIDNVSYVKINRLDIPRGSKINSASMSLTDSQYSQYSGTGLYIRVGACTRDINVSTLKGTNMPDVVNKSPEQYMVGKNSTVYFDITSAVQYIVDNGIKTLCIFAPDDHRGSFTPNRSAYNEFRKGRRYCYTNLVFNINFTSFKPCTISISSTAPSSNVQYNKSMRVNYTANSNDDEFGSSVQYSINGGSWNTVSRSGAGAGYFEFIPSRFGVSEGSSFIISVRRVHSQDSAYNSGTSNVTRYTYSSASVTGLKCSPNPINANTNLSISWNSSGSRTYNRGGSQSTSNPVYDIMINGSTYLTGTSSTSLSVSGGLNGKAGVNYTYDKKNVSISVRVRYEYPGSSGDSVTSTSSSYASSQVKVLYTPTCPIYGLLPSDASINYLSVNNVSLAPSSRVISWSWPRTDYSGYNSNGQNGILVNNYVELLYKDVNDKEILAKTYKSGSTKSITVSVNDLYPNRRYYLRITPVYESGSILLKGPSYTTKDYLMRISKLYKPSIKYPVTGYWYKDLTFRVGIIPPVDPDYNSLTSGDKNTYRYGDIKVKINGIEKLLSSVPNSYSTVKSNLVYKDKMVVNGEQKGIVFNPNLASYGLQSQASYTIQVAFKSNYAPSNLTDMLWSEWSDPVVVTNRYALPTIDTSKDKYILADHINKTFNAIVDMAKSYTVSCNYINYLPGDRIIIANDYNNLNKYLVSLANTLNNFGYIWDNKSVMFSGGQDIVSANEIIMSSGKYNSSTYNKMNYVQRALLWADIVAS